MTYIDAHKEAEFTSPDTSLESTIVYALGIAIEQEQHSQVKEDLLITQQIVMVSKRVLIEHKGTTS